MTGSKDKVPSGVEKPAAVADAITISKALAVPALAHAVVTQAYLRRVAGIEPDQRTIGEGIASESKVVVAGDLSGAERMLMAQATTLNAVCVDLLLRAHANLGEYIGAAETYMKLALKAQNQCRMTLETLAAIKNPPVVYARQANFANGPQQVNNGVTPHAAKNENSPNELLEDKHDKGERLDGGAPGKTIGGNPELAAVGAINRTAKR